MELAEWKYKQKAKLIISVKKELQSRRSLTCEHSDRQYDDDMCDSCFSKRLVDMFQDSIYLPYSTEDIK